MKIRKEDKRVIYYSDELNDDFGNIDLNKIEVNDKYKYKRNLFEKTFGNILYWCFAKPILGGYSLFNGMKVKGKENLKEYYKILKINKTGGFIYANHVSNEDAFYIQCLIINRKRVNVVANPNILSSKLLTFFTRQLGYIPLATTFLNQAKMMKGIEYYLKKKREHILIFPEAHIWPFYTKIRPFKSAAFHYPAKYNAPILPIVTTFKERKNKNKKPRKVVIICKPILPKEGYEIKENKEYLRNETYKEMVEASSSYKQMEYIKYIKKEKEE